MPAPKGVKQPQDHKAAKAEATDEPVVVEFGDQRYTVTPDVFNDVEVLELIGDMQENATLLPKTVRTILGAEQWAAFKNANRNDAGRVPVDCLGDFFEAMDAAVGNSAASSGS